MIEKEASDTWLLKTIKQVPVVQLLAFAVLGITFYNNTNSSIADLTAKANVLERRIDATDASQRQADKEFVVWREKIAVDINATRISQARLEAYLMRDQTYRSRIDER